MIKVRTVTRKEIINRLLDLMNKGVTLTEEQKKLMVDLSK